MKRQKPDLMWVLFLVLGLGVAATSLGGGHETKLPPMSISSNP